MEKARVRVRKEEFQPSAFTKAQPDGLNVCLDCWKLWMKSDDRDLSASRMQFEVREMVVDAFDADGNIIRMAYETNPYDEQLKADNIIGAATGAMIDSLNRWQRWAIQRKCSVVTVWDYPQLDYMNTLVEAETELERKLRKNLATATQF